MRNAKISRNAAQRQRFNPSFIDDLCGSQQYRFG